VLVIHGSWPWIVGQDWTAAAEIEEVTRCQVSERGHIDLQTSTDIMRSVRPTVIVRHK